MFSAVKTGLNSADITITQGDSGEFYVNVPMDTTGLTFHLAVAREIGKPAVLTLSSAANGGITIVDKRVTFKFLPAHTVNMTPGSYVFDAEYTNGTDLVTTFMNGNFTVEGQVAR